VRLRYTPLATLVAALAGAGSLRAQAVTVRLDSAASNRGARVLTWLVDQEGRAAAASVVTGSGEHLLTSRRTGPHALCTRRADGFTVGTPWFELHDGERLQLALVVPADSTLAPDQPLCRRSAAPAGVLLLGSSSEPSAASTAASVRTRVLDATNYGAVPGAQVALRPDGATKVIGTVSDSAGLALAPPMMLGNDGSVVLSLRALGYAPRFLTLPATALRSADSLIVLLTPLPQRLAGVRVEGDRPLPRGLDRRTMAGWTVSEKVMREVRLFARNFGDFVQWQGLAGVRVQNETCVRIRNDGCALVVVDGVPREPLHLYIDPLMIEQIVVLRAQDASTLYGVRGVNGAVLITTSAGERQEERR
jgi:hypothetical protein